MAVDDGRSKLKFDKSLFSLITRLFDKGGKKRKDVLAIVDRVSQYKSSSDGGNEVNYILNRLVRGLASTRVHTQGASFATLVCLLKNGIINAEDVLQASKKELEDGTKSQEIDAKIATILLSGCFIESDLMLKPGLKKTDNLKLMLTHGKSRSYLPSLVYSFLVRFVQNSNKKEFDKNVWPIVSPELPLNWEQQTIDSLYFVFALLNRFTEMIQTIESRLGKVEDNLSYICSTLLTSQSVLAVCHPVFEEFSKYISRSKILFSNFWIIEVEKLLKKVSFNKERRLLLLLSSSFKHVEHIKLIPKILTPQLLHIIMKSSMGKHDFEESRQVLDMLVTVLSSDKVKDKTRVEVINKLMFDGGSLYFEQNTGSKCIQLILQQCKQDGIKLLSNKYIDIITCGQSITDTDKTWRSRDKIHLMHLLVKLLNHSAMKDDWEWKLEKVTSIFGLGFVTNIYVFNDIKRSAADCFLSCLNLHMSSLEQSVLFLDALVNHVTSCVDDGSVVMEEGKVEQWRVMTGVVKKLKKKEIGNKSVQVLHLLILHMGLQLLTDEPSTKENLDELMMCYKHMNSKAKSYTDVEWIEVTVDMLLSLLSRDNKLWRHVTSCVFPHLTQHLTLNTLKQIIDALDPSGEKPALQQHDDLSTIHNESSSDDDEGKDDNRGDDTESDLDDDDDGEKETVNDKLRTAVRDALGGSGAVTDCESEDMDNMNEEEENQLNERLSEAFKMLKGARKTSNKKQNREDTAVMHFRIRVLDLIEIYVLNKPAMGGCIDLILPLVFLLEFSIKDNHQKPLQNRIENILKKISNVKKFSSVENVEVKDIITVLNNVAKQDQISSLVYSEMSPRIVDICLFLIRCSQSLFTDEALKKKKIKTKLDLFGDEYSNLLISYFENKSCRLPLKMFENILKLNWSGNWKLIQVLFSKLNDPNVRLFKKNKIVALILIFYQNERLLSVTNDDQLNMLNDLVENMIVSLVEYFNKYCETPSSALESFLFNFLQLVIISHNCWQKYQKETCSPPPWRDLYTTLDSTQIESLTNRLKTKLLKVSTLLGIEVDQTYFSKVSNKTLKRKLEESVYEEVSEQNKKSKKKKKLTKEKIVLKNESRKLRELAASKGLETISFSNLDVEMPLVVEGQGNDVNGRDKIANGKVKKLKKKG